MDNLIVLLNCITLWIALLILFYSLKDWQE